MNEIMNQSNRLSTILDTTHTGGTSILLFLQITQFDLIAIVLLPIHDDLHSKGGHVDVIVEFGVVGEG
jgi:hypothetical protein